MTAWGLLLALTLALSEAVARIVFPVPDIVNIDRGRYLPQMVSAPLVAQPTLAHATILVESAPDGASSLHELNLNGFRDSEWGIAKKRGRRVFFLGDSIVEGFLTPLDGTIPQVYERLARDGREHLEAWNLGIGGAGFREYVQLMQDVVPAFSPDELILVVHANDLVGSTAFSQDMVKPEYVAEHRSRWTSRLVSVIASTIRGEPVARAWHGAPFSFFAAVPDAANPWTQNGAAYERFVVPDIAEAMRQGRFNPFNVDEVNGFARYLPNPIDPAPWLKFIKAFLDQRGVRLFVVYVPQTGQTTDVYLRYRQRFSAPDAPSLMADRFQAGAVALVRAADSLEIPILDLTDPMRNAEASGQRLYWNYDEHPRPQGYAFIANAIYEWRVRCHGNGID